jgi:hypothetical protein
LNCSFVVDDVDPSDALPPTRTERTFDEPSGKSDAMSTFALGNDRYGELSLEFSEYPMVVVLRMIDLKYAECRACTDPAQLLERPACAGESQLLKPVGSERPQLPFTVRLRECPCDELA